MSNTLIQTYTGKSLDLVNPQAESICIEDIARGISHACRFAGQVSKFYSVAQHSVLVSQMVPEQDALWGLLHDASEAYLCDVVSFLKEMAGFHFYRSIERKMMRAVCTRFGLSHLQPESVHLADKQALKLEAQALKCPLNQQIWDSYLKQIQPYTGPVKLEKPMLPDDAHLCFLERFMQLTKSPSLVEAKIESLHSIPRVSVSNQEENEE